MKKICLLVATIMLISCIFTGCGSANTASSSESLSPSTETQVKRTDLVAALTTDLKNVSPLINGNTHVTRVIRNVYDTLLVVRDGAYKPRLAESWDISSDGLGYTFHLRKGVLFHNGEELTAKDVVATYQCWKDSSQYMQLAGFIKDCTAVDDYTVTFTLNSPNPMFLSYMGDRAFILNKTALDACNGDYADYSVGTGPYKFVSYETGIEAKFESFDQYYLGMPQIKNVTVKFITDPDTIVSSLQTGEIDFVYSVGSSTYQTLAGSEDITAHVSADTTVGFLVMNTQKAPFDNALVRQAVNYAIDRDFLGSAVSDGLGVSTDVMCPKNVVGFPANYSGYYHYDLEKAKSLMAQAGYPDGFAVDGTLITTSGTYLRAAEVYQQALAKLGITVEIEQLDFSVYCQKCYTGDFALCALGIAFPVYDIGYMLQFYQSSSIGGLNIAQYSNPEMDNLIYTALATVDESSRNKLYADILDKCAEEAVYAPTDYRVEVTAWNSALTVNIINGDNIAVFNEMSWN